MVVHQAGANGPQALHWLAAAAMHLSFLHLMPTLLLFGNSNAMDRDVTAAQRHYDQNAHTAEKLTHWHLAADTASRWP